jgi:hypothetical protein
MNEMNYVVYVRCEKSGLYTLPFKTKQLSNYQLFWMDKIAGSLLYIAEKIVAGC